MRRRTFLKGAGAAIGLPLLEAMLNGNGTAHADGTSLPDRFLLFFFGNGVILDQWIPAAQGPNWALTPELAPLVNVKDYVSVLSGYETTKAGGGVAHHAGMAGVLSGRTFIALPFPNADFSSTFAGPSVDQIAAPALGKTVFPSLQLACSKRASVDEGPTLRYLSHLGPNQPLAPETSPAALFSRLFASLAPKDPGDPRDALRASVLDLVRDDVRALQPKLGVNDRRRLDAHLTGISELRQQILALPPAASAACLVPGAVTETNADRNGIERMGEVNAVMAQAIALAYACDLTRVVAYQLNGPVGRTVFSDLGHTEVEHALSHSATPQAQGQVHDAVVYAMKCAAVLFERLKATGDGAGTLLDTVAGVVTSDCAEGLSHSAVDHPMLLVGKANGRLVHPGVHHRSTEGNTSDVMLSVLRAAGVNVPSFGGGASESTTVVPEVLV